MPRPAAAPTPAARAYRPPVTPPGSVVSRRPGVAAICARGLLDHVARHAHPTLEVAALTGGAGRFLFRGAARAVARGAVVVLPAGEAHAAHSVGAAGWDYVMLLVGAAAVDDVGYALADGRRRPAAGPSPGVRDAPALHGRLAALGAHLGTSRAGRALACDVLLLEVLAHLLAGRPADPASRARDDAPAVRRAVDYLHARAPHDVTLDELSAAAAAHPTHLIRAFRAAVGVAPHAYLTYLRVGLAQRLIGAGRPLSAAALDAGFYDQAHLTRHFRRLTGLTPGAYRRAAGVPAALDPPSRR